MFVLNNLHVLRTQQSMKMRQCSAFIFSSYFGERSDIIIRRWTLGVGRSMLDVRFHIKYGFSNRARMKSTSLIALIAVLSVIFLTGDAISAAEGITTEDYWVLRDGYREAFTHDATITVSYESDGFFVDYPGPSGQTLKYDKDGNLIYYWSEYGPDWVYVPDSPQQFLPNVMEIGQSYTCGWLRKEYANGVFQGYGSDSFSLTVSGPHTTTVGAGTFTTYILYVFGNWSTSYGENGASTRIYYLAKDVGWVKMIINGEIYELLDYSIGPPATPTLALTTSGTEVSISWSDLVNANGYTLFYDQYPWDTLTENIDMGSDTRVDFQLWRGATFRLAVRAYNSFGNSDQSNIAYLVIGYPFSIVPSSLAFSAGKTSSCIISGGTRPYSAASSDISVATASITGSTLSVTGIATGSAAITVNDGNADSVAVHITVTPSLNVNPTSLSLFAGAASTCTISGGKPPYNAASSDTAVATVSVSDNTLSVNGVAAGSATVTVTDTSSGSVTIYITVTPSLDVNPTSLSLFAGAASACAISGGAPPYNAVSGNTAVATVSVSDNMLSVNGVAAGSVTVTVTDTSSGSVTIYITVTPSLNVNPTSLSLPANVAGACAISGGKLPYNAVSSDIAVATASVSGSLLSVTGVAAGSAIITVTDGSSGSVTITVTVASSLGVSPASLSLFVDASDSCAISGGTGPYSATSNNPSTATVSITGSTLFITGVAAGSAIITVTDASAESMTIAVTVTSSLSVSPASLSLFVDTSDSCAISGGTGPYSATSNNPSTATVSITGSTLFITGVAAGSATITVTDASSESVTIAITVASSLSVSSTGLSLFAGATDACTISGGKTPYSAASSNTAVATASISNNTLSATGIVAGSTTITVTDASSESVTIHITVTPPLNVNPTRLSLFAGATSACAISGGKTPYNAVSSNTAVATASVTGSLLSVTGVAAGSTIITVTDGGSESMTIAVTVASSLSVSSTGLSLFVGATDTCTTSGGKTPYSAASSNTAVATGSISGNTLSVTGIGAGSATITVTDANSERVTVSVVVRSLSVSPSNLNHSVNETVSCAISGGATPYSAVSSDTTVATVSVNGSTLSVTGVAAGYATITVSDSYSGNTAVSVVIHSLSVSPSGLNLSIRQTTPCTISWGTTPYSAVSSNAAAATVALKGNTLSITGVATGYATITVTDSSSESVTVSVVVIGDLSVNPETRSLLIGQTGYCTISGGTNPYLAASNNPSAAKVSISGATLSVTGVSVGSATIIISDSASNAATVSVTVEP